MNRNTKTLNMCMFIWTTTKKNNNLSEIKNYLNYNFIILLKKFNKIVKKKVNRIELLLK